MLGASIMPLKSGTQSQVLRVQIVASGGKMKSTVTAALLATVLGLTLASAPGFAHHGTGINYDNTKRVVVNGTVTEWEWKNPHAQLYIDAKDDKGNVTHFAVEMNSPGVLSRDGWTRHEFKVGDQVSISVFPSRAGAPIGECATPSTCKITINGQPPATQEPDEY
jgi:hypothetical protein